MKILKSKKALSPVVASIILIAVTVAVSIAVAAWMGALTFTFTATEQVQITDLDFPTGQTAKIYATVRNTGTSPVTIDQAWVNGVKQTIANTTTTISANQEVVFEITLSSAWVKGNTYEVKLVSSKGNAFLRTETAPSS
ncbi:MAG: archaellin/type IV pilin N-terminal domain-containing protein [Candidatus Bathyarchaeales archaeon]